MPKCKRCRQNEAEGEANLQWVKFDSPTLDPPVQTGVSHFDLSPKPQETRAGLCESCYEQLKAQLSN